MLKVLCFCIVLSLYTLQVESQSDEYTWEDYNGTIPPNAMPASDDPNNPVYIGQVFNKEKGYNCTGSIVPETETAIKCSNDLLRDDIKILTVTDKEKFKWQPVNSANFSNIDVKDLVQSNYREFTDSYWYVGRIIWDERQFIKKADGTVEASDIVYNMIYSIKFNVYVEENFDALVRSKEKATKNEIENSKTEQAQEPVKVGSEDLPSQPCLKTSQTEIDASNSGQPTIDANVDLKVEGAVDAKGVPKKQPDTKVPAVLSPEYTWEDYNGTIPPNAMPASGDPNNPVYVGHAFHETMGYNCTGPIVPETETTIKCNYIDLLRDDIKILTVTDKEKFKWQPVNSANFSNIDVKDLVETNYLNSSDTYSYVGRKIWGDQMKEVDRTPEVSEILSNMFYSMKYNKFTGEDFEALVHSGSDAKAASKKQPATKVPGALKPGKPKVDANVDMKVEGAADAKVVPKEQPATKVPATLNPGQTKVDANVNMKVEGAADAKVVPKEQPATKIPAALNPGKPKVDVKVEGAVDAQTAPKAPSAPKLF